MPFQTVRKTSGGLVTESLEFPIYPHTKIIGVNCANETNPCRVTLEIVREGSEEFGHGFISGFPLGDINDLNDTLNYQFMPPFENKDKLIYLLKANFLYSTNLDRLLMRVWFE